MILAGIDTETTGLEPGDHRIIEVHVALWDLGARSKLQAETWRINPERSILPDAQRVHGISYNDLVGCPVWKDVAQPIRLMIESADLLVWHNGESFDRPFIDHELKRAKLSPLTKPGFDTMLEGRWATATGAVPNLGMLCFACGIDYDETKAHAADYDVDVMMQCFFRGVDWGWFKIQGAPASAIAA